MGIAYNLIAGYGFPVDYDVVYVHRTHEFDPERQRVIRIDGGPTIHRRWMGAHVEMGAPFTFIACKKTANGPESVPHTAELLKVDDGQLIPVGAEFNLKQEWVEWYIGESCLLDLLQFDADIETRDIYCIDLHYIWHEKERTDRDCWKFKHESGVWGISVIDILMQ